MTGGRLPRVVVFRMPVDFNCSMYHRQLLISEPYNGDITSLDLWYAIPENDDIPPMEGWGHRFGDDDQDRVRRINDQRNSLPCHEHATDCQKEVQKFADLHSHRE